MTHPRPDRLDADASVPYRRESVGQSALTRVRGKLPPLLWAVNSLVLAIFAATTTAAQEAPCTLSGFKPGELIDFKDKRLSRNKPTVYKPLGAHVFEVGGKRDVRYRTYLEATVAGRIVAVVREYDANYSQEAYLALEAKYGPADVNYEGTPELRLDSYGTIKVSNRAFWKDASCGQGVQFIRQSKPNIPGASAKGAVVLTRLNEAGGQSELVN